MSGSKRSIVKEGLIVAIIFVAVLSVGGYAAWNFAQAIYSVQEAPPSQQADRLSIVTAIKKKLVSVSKQEITAVEQRNKIQQVQFFTAGKSAPAVKSRTYQTSFSKRANYIYTEILYQNSNYKKRDDKIAITIEYYDEQGNLIDKKQTISRPKKEWASVRFSLGIAANAQQAGEWQSGRHIVKIFFDGQQVGQYHFDII